MGEARRRGTYEERKTLAESAAKQYRQEQEQLRREREAAMLPEQIKKRTNTHIMSAISSAMAMGFVASDITRSGNQ